MTAWYIDQGPERDVIISSRIRLARNFKDFPFPTRMNREQGEQVIKKSKEAILENITLTSQSFEFIPMNSLSVIDRQVMVEKHLVSPEMLQNVHSRGVFLNKAENISIMVNEEDHLRIQCLFTGMQLDEAWDSANKLDNVLEEKIAYAYSEDYGYLTSCPTNVGTGMRASVMIHLPALAITGYLNSLLSAVSKLGIAVRGLYGEGTEARGNVFQISNQITMGISEEETLENLKGIVKQIIDQERMARNKLLQESRLRLEDKLYRSYGIFKNARVMSSEEFMKLFSDVRLGINMGIIKDVSLETLNTLMIATQPANIMQRFGSNLSPEERDVKRAELIREKVR
ncbi:MAG: protein arginine kinase [Clostridiales bacterium]|jgi:protein arginine kinase|nr:protein arginine kinase [Clostridiales bacterium]